MSLWDFLTDAARMGNLQTIKDNWSFSTSDKLTEEILYIFVVNTDIDGVKVFTQMILDESESVGAGNRLDLSFEDVDFSRIRQATNNETIKKILDEM